MNVIVFDIGGTLMEYTNMPNVWIDWYDSAFRHVRDKLGLPLTDAQLEASIEVLKQYNPRVKYREKDHSPEQIFSDAAAGWGFPYSLQEVISAFFEDMHLTPLIYPETIQVLKKLRSAGWKIATLTDVATGMPDELHKSYFPELMPYFDMYVSSQSCGFRKPNPAVHIRGRRAQGHQDREECRLPLSSHRQEKPRSASRAGLYNNHS